MVPLNVQGVHSALPFESCLGCRCQAPGALSALWVHSHFGTVPVPTLNLYSGPDGVGSVKAAPVYPALAAFEPRKSYAAKNGTWPTLFYFSMFINQDLTR